MGTFAVDAFSSIRFYAFVRAPGPDVTLYVINPDIHDNVGTDPDVGALAKVTVTALQGQTAWYPLPGTRLSIEAFVAEAGSLDLRLYGCY